MRRKNVDYTYFIGIMIDKHSNWAFQLECLSIITSKAHIKSLKILILV